MCRYGIMEKLKRLQEGEDVEDLLAEMDEEMPSCSEDEEEVDEETLGLTEVQKKVMMLEISRWKLKYFFSLRSI